MLSALGLCPVVSGACASDPPAEGLAPLPRLTTAPLTVDRTLVPQHAFEMPPDARSPADPRVRAEMLAEGFGDYTIGPGEPHVTRTPSGDAPPIPGASAKLLVRFAHLADVQLADDESPSRVASLDGPGTLDAAFRPHEADVCRMLNAAVRTIDAVHARTPLSFVLTGGDNIDSAQGNELEWVLGILGGGRAIECDSGADDDPLPDTADDPKDAFLPVGLDVPWYWVTGNHDVCVQGNFEVASEVIAKAVGEVAETGTRDWRLPGAPVVTGVVPADARRRPLVRSELMARIAADGDGHGIGADQIASGKAFYRFDVPDTPLSFVVLDTSAETGGSGGMIHRADLDARIRPLLDAARDQGRWVVLASHHALQGLGRGDDFGGTAQADAVLREEWLGFLGGYPNILFAIVGHSHVHRVERVEPPVEGHAFWQVLTSALADHPHQVRVIEIFDQDNGWVMLRATALDFASHDDAVAEEGRRLGLLDRVSGWWNKGTGRPEDRNVELWIPKP